MTNSLMERKYQNRIDKEVTDSSGELLDLPDIDEVRYKNDAQYKAIVNERIREVNAFNAKLLEERESKSKSGKSMLNPEEREQYGLGSLVAKKLAKPLTSLFNKDASSDTIENVMKQAHKAVEQAPSGLKRSEVFKQVAEDQDLTVQNVKDIEKVFAYRAGGGGKENILGEVKQVIKAMTTKPTSGQADAEAFGGARTTREARKKAGEVFIGTAAVTVPSTAALSYLAFSPAQEAKIKENKTSTVTDITSGTMDSAFSKASKSPTKYVFMKEGQPHFKYKGQDVPFSLATEEDDVVLDMTPRSKKAKGGLPDLTGDGKITQADVLKGRGVFNEGGSMLMPTEGMPVDTYSNIPEDEMDEALASQLPDDEMEDDYISYVMDESLDDDEQMYLAGVLKDDPKLSDIMDKVITTASEFSGAGEVDGPGTGVSDSIPARLSDGEFVITKKATDQIGADNLQIMMDDAERAYDGGYQMKAIGGYMLDQDDNISESKAEEEIRKLMMGANRMPSL